MPRLYEIRRILNDFNINKEIKMKKLLAIVLILSICLAGCAHTTANPVPVAQVGDETKTCDAIANEMQQMVSTQQTADGDRNNQIGANAALGVTGIFLLGIPWFFMDLGSAASVEQKAAQARYQRLQQMQIDKKCPATPVIIEQTVGTSGGVIQTATPIMQPPTPSLARAAITPTGKSHPASEMPNPAKRLEDLNAMLKKGLITQDEYNAKKTEILNNM